MVIDQAVDQRKTGHDFIVSGVSWKGTVHGTDRKDRRAIESRLAYLYASSIDMVSFEEADVLSRTWLAGPTSCCIVWRALRAKRAAFSATVVSKEVGSRGVHAGQLLATFKQHFTPTAPMISVLPKQITFKI
jgi:hypothetical protein